MVPFRIFPAFSSQPFHTYTSGINCVMPVEQVFSILIHKRNVPVVISINGELSGTKICFHSYLTNRKSQSYVPLMLSTTYALDTVCGYYYFKCVFFIQVFLN